LGELTHTGGRSPSGLIGGKKKKKIMEEKTGRGPGEFIENGYLRRRQRHIKPTESNNERRPRLPLGPNQVFEGPEYLETPGRLGSPVSCPVSF